MVGSEQPAGHTLPQIAVVTPTYNRAALLRRALESVRAQTLTSFEVIVVDDGSTDETEDLVASFGDKRFRYVRQERAGAAKARNLGVERSTAELVTFLDSDDEVDPDWLSSLVEPFEDPGVGVACAGLRRLEEDASPPTETVMLPQNDGILYGDQPTLFLPAAFAVRRSIFLEVGGYADLAARQQKQLGRHLAAYCVDNGLKIATIARPLSTWHRHPGERISTDLRAQYDGIVGTLDVDGDFILSRSRREYAKFQILAAVSAERLGLHREARRHYARAARHHPYNWRIYARLALNLAGKPRC